MACLVYVGFAFIFFIDLNDFLVVLVSGHFGGVGCCDWRDGVIRCDIHFFLIARFVGIAGGVWHVWSLFMFH